MKKIILAVLLFHFLSISSQAQQDSGIHFEQGLSWQQIKEKAKAEHEYIFVDCFATWCGPCKKMDAEVYPLDSIGQLFNQNFISVKAQMDSTAKDDEQVKRFRTDSRNLQSAYQVNAFPTFLFFSPEGNIVHKGIGFMDARGFHKLALDALDPSKQYYSLISRFRQGKLGYPELYSFSFLAQSFHDNNLADSAASSYINHLYELGEDSIYTEKNLTIIINYTRSSTAKTFDLFYHHGAKIDSIVRRPDFARNRVDGIIDNEEIYGKLYRDGTFATDHPDWTAIQSHIEKKYNRDYAARTVLWAKVKWYEQKKDWKNYTTNVIRKVEKYGPYDKAFYQKPNHEFALWNFSAWEVFQYSNNPAELKKALEWSKKSITLAPTSDQFGLSESMDTYANILYKLHRKKEAMEWEQKALKNNPKATDIADNFSKMKKDAPTWPVAPSK